MSELKQVTPLHGRCLLRKPGGGRLGRHPHLRGAPTRAFGAERRKRPTTAWSSPPSSKGLERLKFPCRVDVYSDSAYTVNGFLQGWVYAWEKRGWIKPDKKPVLNDDLWKKLLALTRGTRGPLP